MQDAADSAYSNGFHDISLLSEGPLTGRRVRTVAGRLHGGEGSFTGEREPKTVSRYMQYL